MELSIAGIHRDFLRKYGGFVFKQWKEKYVVLTLEGSLIVRKDADSPPDQVVALLSNFWSVVDGREIMDLPRLPAGGRRDCCFALVLSQGKFLLLLSDNPEECSQWLKLLRKIKEGMSAPLTRKRQRSIIPCITDRALLLDTATGKEPLPPDFSDTSNNSPHAQSRRNSVRRRGSVCHRHSASLTHPSQDCLRHGNSSDVRDVRAVCLLMGRSAASSTLGYVNSCSLSSSVGTWVPDTFHSPAFPEVGWATSLHSCTQGLDTPHFNSFDFDGNFDFDAFDCDGFTF